jgi:GH43 family beta-xylosidase
MNELPYQPVYPTYFADPFVLEHQGRYYAYGTGTGALGNGCYFEILSSDDLVNWHSHGGALRPLATGQTDYWAPEVAFCDDQFYMYYSAGFGDKQQMRVATSSQPQGPFTDTGATLVKNEPFSIDGHPFQDDDGTWYLFYAKDFLEGDRVGTGVVVDRLETMTQLSGHARTVLRATHDWQIYQRNRPMYDSSFDWHTVEGPFVVKRQDRYYCFYSGGAWIDPTYGVSYTVADHPLGPWNIPDHDGPLVLRTLTHQIGPGHNSVIRGPDGQDHIVYHAWDEEHTARRMHTAPIQWTQGGPRVAAFNP